MIAVLLAVVEIVAGAVVVAVAATIGSKPVVDVTGGTGRPRLCNAMLPPLNLPTLSSVKTA